MNTLSQHVHFLNMALYWKHFHGFNSHKTNWWWKLKTKNNNNGVRPCSQQHLWEDETRNKANGGLNACGSSIFNNMQNNNCNGFNGQSDGNSNDNGNTCINNNHQNQCNGSDKVSPELFAISFTERMRRHSTMSHKIVIKPKHIDHHREISQNREARKNSFEIYQKKWIDWQKANFKLTK